MWPSVVLVMRVSDLPPLAPREARTPPSSSRSHIFEAPSELELCAKDKEFSALCAHESVLFCWKTGNQRIGSFFLSGDVADLPWFWAGPYPPRL